MKGYIILSPERSTPDAPIFWCANASGYSPHAFMAGIYTEEQVKASPDYYNNGCNSVAIPLTEEAIAKLGLKCSYSKKANALEQFFQTAKS